jgi:hypothetical protein
LTGKEIDSLEDLEVGRIILRIRTNGGSCKRFNEPSGSIKAGEHLD